MYKKILLGLGLAFIVNYALAQQTNGIRPLREKGAYDLNLYGGLSMPLGAYAGTVGSARSGFSAGLNFDYYFLLNNRLGLSFGLLYQTHGKDSIKTNGAYNFTFTNGYSTFYQDQKATYRQFGLFLGPVYKVYASARWNASVYAKIGFVNQHNPDFYQTLYAYNATTQKYVIVKIPYTALNYDSPPISLMSNFGLNVQYKITPKIGIGFRAEYLSITEGTGRIGEVVYAQKKSLEPNGITVNSKNVSDVDLYFDTEGTAKSSVPIQSLNFNVGIHYTF
ncbi:hypothetical protein DBR32_13880 [Taibaiella sp. KBW10]|uniref:hypothetical protein n=1 Tax=Taibaiella sp. KBW10 TaxID=2153357 RepID=UPI000F5A63B9|nr:hypothetical protein [Taibaiella sp. KBW10]RQO29997.1 hypothetical protein DBR32_13880 [Taibaiella sp. KBW10]